MKKIYINQSINQSIDRSTTQCFSTFEWDIFENRLDFQPKNAFCSSKRLTNPQTRAWRRSFPSLVQFHFAPVRGERHSRSAENTGTAGGKGFLPFARKKINSINFQTSKRSNVMSGGATNHFPLTKNVEYCSFQSGGMLEEEEAHVKWTQPCGKSILAKNQCTKNEPIRANVLTRMNVKMRIFLRKKKGRSHTCAPNRSWNATSPTPWSFPSVPLPFRADTAAKRATETSWYTSERASTPPVVDFPRPTSRRPSPGRKRTFPRPENAWRRIGSPPPPSRSAARECAASGWWPSRPERPPDTAGQAFDRRTFWCTCRFLPRRRQWGRPRLLGTPRGAVWWDRRWRRAVGRRRGCVACHGDRSAPRGPFSMGDCSWRNGGRAGNRSVATRRSDSPSLTRRKRTNQDKLIDWLVSSTINKHQWY